MTLMEHLKMATAGPHAQLEATPFFVALLAGQLPLESYVGQLRALAMAHSILEPALANCDDVAVASVWREDLRKLPLLQSDLNFFEARWVADIKEAVEHSLQLGEAIRLKSAEESLALLGYLYVLEGSTLGSSVVRSKIAKSFLLRTDGGLAYVSSYGPAVHAHWEEFRQRMNAFSPTQEQREIIVAAAADLFSRLTMIFQALYPFSQESKVFLATSINPEAGRHAVPADPREIKATIQAADLCWARFPYLEFRYGERGRRFANSDGAWLATLCHFDPARIIQQVRWLGRVLSTRGIPTLMLEAKLEMTFTALVAAVPENRSLYEKYLPAAADLREARRGVINDARFQHLAADFNQAVGPEWSERYRNAGELLIAAVADEQNGAIGTLANVRTWMTDPARFPAEWIESVEKILAEGARIV